jgi:hypothetical protein
MDKALRNEMLTILLLTVLFGIGAYFLANVVDKSISDIEEKKHTIDELTRIAGDQESQVDQLDSMDNFEMVLEENLASIDELPEMLSQLETMASITNNDITIKLEEGVISDTGVSFKDEKEKNAFLQGLEVKEFTAPVTAPTDEAAQSGNVVLQLQEEQVQEESRLTINYIEISVLMTGSYDHIREFIDLLQNSRYFFNIKEIRLSKKENGFVEANMGLRAFFFESNK